MPGERIADGLRYRRDGNDLYAWCDRVWPELWLRFRVGDRRLFPASLVLDGKHATDLSGQPAAITAMLREAALQIGTNPDAWFARLTTRIQNDAGDLGLGAVPAIESPETRLIATLGGLRYPLLSAAYNEGCSVERFVPRWARAGLDASDASGAAGALFEARSTRSVVRALGTWVTTPTEEAGRLGWASLAIAVAGAGVLEPDDIAGALARFERQEVTMMSVDDVALLRSVAGALGAGPFKAIAFEALEHDLVAKLLKVCELVRRVGGLLRPPFPSRLDELERAAIAVAILDVHAANAGPAAASASSSVVPVVDAPPAPPRRAPRRFEQALNAPRAPRTGVIEAFDYAPAVRALDDLVIGPVVLSLPATPQHLRQWSRALSNCLDDFVAAVDSRRSTIVGIWLEHRLIGALEIDGSMRVRQFLGRANRPLHRSITDPVLRELAERGVIVSVA
ncbi:MAG: hypothetical protein Q8K63_10185 [Acidimicrobiales bacterium]|nr:hypothetical protein [Acidimicrobiales bacterium]